MSRFSEHHFKHAVGWTPERLPERLRPGDLPTLKDFFRDLHGVQREPWTRSGEAEREYLRSQPFRSEAYRERSDAPGGLSGRSLAGAAVFARPGARAPGPLSAPAFDLGRIDLFPEHDAVSDPVVSRSLDNRVAKQFALVRSNPASDRRRFNPAPTEMNLYGAPYAGVGRTATQVRSLKRREVLFAHAKIGQRSNARPAGGPRTFGQFNRQYRAGLMP